MTLSTEQCAGPRMPQARQSFGLIRVARELVEPVRQWGVEYPEWQGVSECNSGGVAVPQLVTGRSELGLNLSQTLWGDPLSKGTKSGFVRSARWIGPSTPHRQIRKLQQYFRFRREPGRLLNCEKCLARSPQPDFEYLSQLAKRQRGGSGVALLLRKSRSLLERQRQPIHVAPAAMHRAQLSQGRNVVRLQPQDLGKRNRCQLRVKSEIARHYCQSSVMARPLLGIRRQQRECLQTARHLSSIAPAFSQSQKCLQRDPVQGVRLKRGRKEGLRFRRIAQAAAM